ncbi:NADPH-dependent FMN reductase family protein [Cyclobacterium roseum]|uniref:hypothetical protein n=1 Tax=Cyclobacterium roseum TaxID=2666137 RepID=UPI001391112F|nr:hypothetical protein [Cyclobacterium roseum]
MRNILVLMAHPTFEHSRIMKGMVTEVQDMPHVTIRELYKLDSDFYGKASMQEKLLNSELNRRFSLNDHAWDASVIKEGLKENKEKGGS